MDQIDYVKTVKLPAILEMRWIYEYLILDPKGRFHKPTEEGYFFSHSFWMCMFPPIFGCTYVRGALNFFFKVQTLTEPPYPSPPPPWFSQPIFSYRSSTSPPFIEVQSLLFFSYKILIPPFLVTTILY